MQTAERSPAAGVASSAARPIRMMLVDEDELVRNGIARLIADETNMEVVGQAISEEAAPGLLDSAAPEVVLVDVKLSGLVGLDTIQRIVRAEQPRITPFDSPSQRELQVALMLIDSHKVNRISDKICLSLKTIYSYRYRIFEKLELSSDIELTILAVRHGLSDARALNSAS